MAPTTHTLPNHKTHSTTRNSQPKHQHTPNSSNHHQPHQPTRKRTTNTNPRLIINRKSNATNLTINLNQTIIREIYNTLRQHLPSKHIIHMYKNAEAIHIATAYVYAYIYVYVYGNTITIKWPQLHIHYPITTQHEIANPNTNIPQITQTILNFINFINQPENESILTSHHNPEENSNERRNENHNHPQRRMHSDSNTSNRNAQRQPQTPTPKMPPTIHRIRLPPHRTGHGEKNRGLYRSTYQKNDHPACRSKRPTTHRARSIP